MPHHALPRRPAAARTALPRAVLALSLGLLGGCASFRAGFNELGNQGEASEQYESVDRHSSYPAMRRREFEQVNLLELVDPRNDAPKAYRTDKGDRADKDTGYGRRYDLALAWFRSPDNPESPEQKRLHRDGVQDKILAVSTSRCNVFKTFLRRQQSDVNFSLGSLTTAAGVLGAILPGATASRNLAGAAGLFSGLQAEYNQAYFSNLAAHVIVQGIELRQNRLKHDLLNGRKDKGIEAYSMEAAINDAIVIDGSCATLAGLMEAQDSIKEVESPGLRMAARTIAGFRALQELNSGDKAFSLQAADGSLDKLLSSAAGQVPSLMVTASRGSATDITAQAQAGAATAGMLRQQLQAQAAALAGTWQALQQDAGDHKSTLGADALAQAATEAALAGLGLPADANTPPPDPYKTCTNRLADAASARQQAITRLGLLKSGGAETEAAALAVDVAEAQLRLLLAQAAAVRQQAGAQLTAGMAALRAGLPKGDALKAFDGPKAKALVDETLKPALNPARRTATCG